MNSLRNALLPAVVSLLLMGIARVLMEFFTDDAFITLRYSENLSSGWGPVYNPWDNVEGYTNFLWMLWLTLPHLLGMEPTAFAHDTAVAFMSGTLVLWYLMLKQEFAQRFAAPVLFLAIATQFSLLGSAFSGMETSLNVFLITGVYFLLAKSEKENRAVPPWGLGVLLGFCLLSRPDNLLLVVVVGFTLWRTNRLPQGIHKMKVAGGFLLPVLPWLMMKLAVYGHLLPNTFLAKGGGSGFYYGAAYLLLFAITTLLPLGTLLAGLAWMIKKSKAGLLTQLLMLHTSLWMLYLLWMGGDFMEFRMMAPVIPAFIYLFAWGIRELTREKWVLAAGVLLIAVNGLFAAGFGKWYYTGFVISRERLKAETGNDSTGLISLGKYFHEINPEGNLILATGTAGALPYYSGQIVIDMLGLNDRYVAKYGMETHGIPGHAKFAPFSYLQQRQVNLIVGRWIIPYAEHRHDTIPLSHPDLKAMVGDFDPDIHFRNLHLVEFRVPDGILMAVYLNDHPAIEKLIREGKAMKLPVDIWK